VQNTLNDKLFICQFVLNHFKIIYGIMHIQITFDNGIVYLILVNFVIGHPFIYYVNMHTQITFDIGNEYPISVNSVIGLQTIVDMYVSYSIS